MHRMHDSSESELLAGRDAKRIARFALVFGPFARVWFRYRMRGLEKLPPAPCLIVANHSAMGICEVLCMLAAWHAHFGDARPIHGLAHDLGVRVPVLGSWLRAAGGVRASRANAMAVLGAGRDVLVFPGGDLDGCRPFYQPRRVHFGGRRGYLHIARAAAVPIVPLATIGSHYTMLMAPGGAIVARTLRLQRLLRIERVPLPVGLMTSLVASALTFARVAPLGAGVALAIAGLTVPPARITSEFLPPIDASDDNTERAHARVHGTLARTVAQMAH